MRFFIHNIALSNQFLEAMEFIQVGLLEINLP